MNNLTLGDMNLGLANLLTDRKAHVDACAAGLLYGPMLAEKLTAIEALPEALRGGRPLAESLAQTDDEYDGFGGALWAYTEAVLLAPTSTPDQQAAAQRIRDAFISSKAMLQDSYAEEAIAAKNHRAKLTERKTDLQSFPVPGGKTLFDWAEGFLDKGDALDDLLNQRATAEVGQGTRKLAGQLRSETLGLLYQFRASVRSEITYKKLSSDLEGHIFGYLDELSSRRPGRKSKTPAPTPTAAPAATGG